MAPRWPQDGPRWPQDGPRWPKMAPRWPKRGHQKSMKSNGFLMILRWVTSRRRTLGTFFMLSFAALLSSFASAAGRPQDGPRWPQDGPRWPEDGHKVAQDGPKVAQEGPPQSIKNHWVFKDSTLCALIFARRQRTLCTFVVFVFCSTVHFCATSTHFGHFF